MGFTERFRENVAKQNAEAAGDPIQGIYNFVELYADRVKTPSGVFPLEAGVTAGVDTAGEIERRVTATRLVLTGPFALALRKKKDRRELFLYIDSPAGQHVEPCDPKDQARVRKFAAQITTAARVRNPV